MEAANRRSASFHKLHVALAATLFAMAGALHARLAYDGLLPAWLQGWPLLIVLLLGTGLALLLLTRIAAWLTAYEGTYRGYRLQLPVVMRVLHYHAAQYALVALLTAITVTGFYVLYQRRLVSEAAVVKYLYVLSGEVVLAAAFLFNRYWIGMRNTMYGSPPESAAGNAPASGVGG